MSWREYFSIKSLSKNLIYNVHSFKKWAFLSFLKFRMQPSKVRHKEFKEMASRKK